MEIIDYKPKVHLFICTRSREDKANCASKGAEQLVKDLKQWIKSEKLYFDIKVSKSSCLGYCETGISACVYPKNQWMHKISTENIEEIKKMLIQLAN